MRQILLVLLGNDCPKPTAKKPIPIDYYLIAEELVKAGSKIFVIMKMSPIKVYLPSVTDYIFLSIVSQNCIQISIE